MNRLMMIVVIMMLLIKDKINNGINRKYFQTMMITLIEKLGEEIIWYH